MFRSNKALNFVLYAKSKTRQKTWRNETKHQLTAGLSILLFIPLQLLSFPFHEIPITMDKSGHRQTQSIVQKHNERCFTDKACYGDVVRETRFFL